MSLSFLQVQNAEWDELIYILSHFFSNINVHQQEASESWYYLEPIYEAKVVSYSLQAKLECMLFIKMVS